MGILLSYVFIYYHTSSPHPLSHLCPSFPLTELTPSPNVFHRPILACFIRNSWSRPHSNTRRSPAVYPLGSPNARQTSMGDRTRLRRQNQHDRHLLSHLRLVMPCNMVTGQVFRCTHIFRFGAGIHWWNDLVSCNANHGPRCWGQRCRFSFGDFLGGLCTVSSGRTAYRGSASGIFAEGARETRSRSVLYFYRSMWWDGRIERVVLVWCKAVSAGQLEDIEDYIIYLQCISYAFSYLITCRRDLFRKCHPDSLLTMDKLSAVHR